MKKSKGLMIKCMTNILGMFILIVLTGCGGGSGSSSTPPSVSSASVIYKVPLSSGDAGGLDFYASFVDSVTIYGQFNLQAILDVSDTGGDIAVVAVTVKDSGGTVYKTLSGPVYNSVGKQSGLIMVSFNPTTGGYLGTGVDMTQFLTGYIYEFYLIDSSGAKSALYTVKNVIQQ